jgi:hypothetical protein
VEGILILGLRALNLHQAKPLPSQREMREGFSAFSPTFLSLDGRGSLNLFRKKVRVNRN